MKNNLKNELKENYTIVPNDLIRDNSLSDRARFVFCLLASKPDDWIFYNNALAKELNYCVDTLRKYINELVQKGWLEKIEFQFKANDYILKATNLTASENPRHQESSTPKNSYTYKEILTQRNNSNKEIYKPPNLKKRMNDFELEIMLYKGEFPPEMLQGFWDYWSEPNSSQTKMRKELQKTWETKRRLNNWNKNRDKFNGKDKKPYRKGDVDFSKYQREFDTIKSRRT